MLILTFLYNEYCSFIFNGSDTVVPRNYTSTPLLTWLSHLPLIRRFQSPAKWYFPVCQFRLARFYFVRADLRLLLQASTFAQYILARFKSSEFTTKETLTFDAPCDIISIGIFSLEKVRKTVAKTSLDFRTSVIRVNIDLSCTVLKPVYRMLYLTVVLLLVHGQGDWDFWTGHHVHR